MTSNLHLIDKETVISYDSNSILTIDGVLFRVTKEGANQLINFINHLGSRTIIKTATSRRWQKDVELKIREIIKENKCITYREMAKRVGLNGPQSAKYYHDKIFAMMLEEGKINDK